MVAERFILSFILYFKVSLGFGSILSSDSFHQPIQKRYFFWKTNDKLLAGIFSVSLCIRPV